LGEVERNAEMTPAGVLKQPVSEEQQMFATVAKLEGHLARTRKILKSKNPTKNSEITGEGKTNLELSHRHMPVPL
jgi:hypothetical protein